MKNRKTTVLCATLQAHVCGRSRQKGTCTLLTAMAPAPEGVYLEILPSPCYLFSQACSMSQNFCFALFLKVPLGAFFSFVNLPCCCSAHLSWQWLRVLICILYADVRAPRRRRWNNSWPPSPRRPTLSSPSPC